MLVPMLKAWWHRKKVSLPDIICITYVWACYYRPTWVARMGSRWKRITNLWRMKDCSRNIWRWVDWTGLATAESSN